MNLERQLSPRQFAKQQRILVAALKVFSDAGYNAASMDAIAYAAEVSKPTLYMYFGSKQQLFESMMKAQLDLMLQPFERPSGDMVRDLVDFAWHYADVVMRPDILSLARLVIGEAQRFPAIGRAYQKAGPDKLLSGIVAYLEGQKSRGHLTFSDGELAAQDFWALILSAPRNKALYIPDDLPSRAAVRRYLENGLKVFIKAYSTHIDTDLKRLAEVLKTTRVGNRARKTDR